MFQLVVFSGHPRYTHGDRDIYIGRYNAMPVKSTLMPSSGPDQLIKNPKYREILQRAVELEDQHSQDQNWFGWEWHEVRAYPASLVKLVIAGIIRITFKSNSSTTYRVVDLKAVKEGLRV
jgi:hypothetical protein